MKAIKTILYVENDPVSLTMYQNRLQREGFHVETAQDGLVALRTLSQMTPDLVVLDLMLPRFSGSDVFKIMRTDRRLKHVPVVIFSNAAMTEWPQDLAVGVTACLPKSESTFPMLLQAIHELLAAAPASEAPAIRTASPPVVKPVSNVSAAEVRPAALSAPVAADAGSATGRSAFLKAALAEIPKLREYCLAYIKAPGTEASRQQLSTLHQRIQFFSSTAAQNGCSRVQLLTNTFSALLSEIMAKPSWATTSVLQTMAQAMDCLRLLLNHNEPPVTQHAARGKVLAVDDDPVCNHVIVTTLKRANIDAMTAENPVMALDLLQANRYDLVLLDVNMPDLNGFEICVKLRRLPHCKTVPVIFVTAFNNFDNRKQSVLSGGNDFITKPISPLELALKVTIHMLKAQVQRASLPPGEAEPAAPEPARIAPPLVAPLASQPAPRPAESNPVILPPQPVTPFPISSTSVFSGSPVTPPPSSQPYPADPAPSPQFEPIAGENPTSANPTSPAAGAPDEDDEMFAAAEMILPPRSSEPNRAAAAETTPQSAAPAPAPQFEPIAAENPAPSNPSSPATESPVEDDEIFAAAEMASAALSNELCPAETAETTPQPAAPAPQFEPIAAENPTFADSTPPAAETAGEPAPTFSESGMIPPPPTTEPYPATQSEVVRQPSSPAPLFGSATVGNTTTSSPFQPAAESGEQQRQSFSSSEMIPPPPLTEPYPASTSEVAQRSAAETPAAGFQQTPPDHTVPSYPVPAASRTPAEYAQMFTVSENVTPPQFNEPPAAATPEIAPQPSAAHQTSQFERTVAENLAQSNPTPSVPEPKAESGQSSRASEMIPPPPLTQPYPATVSQVAPQPAAPAPAPASEPEFDTEFERAVAANLAHANPTPPVAEPHKDSGQSSPAPEMPPPPPLTEPYPATVSQITPQPAASAPASEPEFDTEFERAVAANLAHANPTPPVAEPHKDSGQSSRAPEMMPPPPLTQPYPATVSQVAPQPAAPASEPEFDTEFERAVAANLVHANPTPPRTEPHPDSGQSARMPDTMPPLPLTQPYPATTPEAAQQPATQTPAARFEPATTDHVVPVGQTPPVAETPAQSASTFTASEIIPPPRSSEPFATTASEAAQQPATQTPAARFEPATTDHAVPASQTPPVAETPAQPAPTFTASEIIPPPQLSEPFATTASEAAQQPATQTPSARFEPATTDHAVSASQTPPVAETPAQSAPTFTTSEIIPPLQLSEPFATTASEAAQQPATQTPAARFEPTTTDQAAPVSQTPPIAETPAQAAPTFTASEIIPPLQLSEPSAATTSEAAQQPAAPSPVAQFGQPSTESTAPSDPKPVAIQSPAPQEHAFAASETVPPPPSPEVPTVAATKIESATADNTVTSGPTPMSAESPVAAPQTFTSSDVIQPPRPSESYPAMGLEGAQQSLAQSPAAKFEPAATENSVPSAAAAPAIGSSTENVEPVHASEATPSIPVPAPVNVSENAVEPSPSVAANPPQSGGAQPSAPAGAFASTTESGTSDAAGAASSSDRPVSSVTAASSESRPVAGLSVPFTESHSNGAGSLEPSSPASPTSEALPFSVTEGKFQSEPANDVSQIKNGGEQNPALSGGALPEHGSGNGEASIMDSRMVASPTTQPSATATADSSLEPITPVQASRTERGESQSIVPASVLLPATESGTSDPLVEDFARGSSSAAEPVAPGVREFAVVPAGPRDFGSATAPATAPAASPSGSAADAQPMMPPADPTYDQIVQQVARIIFGNEPLTDIKIRLVRIALERYTVQEILNGRAGR